MAGKVYFCPTPIGNLEDITLRALRVMKEADLILAEDTRHSMPLLKHYDIHTPLESYHKFNEEEKIEGILKRLDEGKDIALISDAGMPGVSDPGAVLLSALLKEGRPFEVLPGPSAHVCASVIAGLDEGRYLFWGFLPQKHGARVKALEELADIPVPVIFYEAPHRIQRFAEDVLAALGNRPLIFVREISKMYEERVETTAADFLQNMEDFTIKGEFAVVLMPGEEEKEEIDIAAALRERMDGGESPSKAVKSVAKALNLPKNLVYKESLKL